MRAGKHRYKFRVIAFLMALFLTVSDTEMIALAKTGTVEADVVFDATMQGNENTVESIEEGTGEDLSADKGTEEKGTEEGSSAEEGTEENFSEEETVETEETQTETDMDETEETSTVTESLPKVVLDNEVLNDTVGTLDVPGNVSVTNAVDLGKKHILSWDAVPGATAYEISFAIDGGVSPEKLTEDDFRVYKVIASSDSNLCVSEDGKSLSYKIGTTAISGDADTWEIVLPVDPDHTSFKNKTNYRPLKAQYAVYRIKAVVTDENHAYTAESAYSEYASVNGLYYAEMDEINKDLREKFHMPGTGPYVRFFLGDETGKEYNMDNPIVLHVGESIDNLTLWAVCEDGSKVSYASMRDAVKKAETEKWGSASYYKETSSNGYNFIWEIGESLFNDNRNEDSSGEHIQLFWKYLGNTVPDCRGIKAVAATDEQMFLDVSLNGDGASSSGVGPNLWFYVPIQILEAEEGVTYPDLDETPLIFEDAEQMWAVFREKLHNRKEEFTIGLTEEAYYTFLEENGYYTVCDWELCCDEILDTWLFTQYEEQDWMEPWAGDNLKDAMSGCGYSMKTVRRGSETFYVISWSAQYYTTAQQEQVLDAKIAELLGEGGALHDAYVSGSQLDKIKAAYNYTRGITWVDGTKNPLNYTPYSGIVLRKGSCESFSLTFVRLCREMGVQARVVKDDYWGGAGNHAWNIVEYKGLWYYVDCGSNTFMKGSAGFNSGKQLQLYRTEPFTSSHPISKSDYAMRTVTYNLNGGTNGEGNPYTYEPGAELTFVPPVKTGYTFEGWYADSAFKTLVTGPEGGTFSTVSVPGNLNLYAKWRANQYIISYDRNIPDGAMVKTDATVSDMTVKFNETVKIATNSFALYKYVFTGWNTEADGTGQAYKAGTSVKNLATEDGAEYKLYAQWAPTTYTVRYDGNGSSVGLSARGKTANTTMKFYSDTNATAANGFVINGYKFVGWNTRADGRGLTLGGEEGKGYAVIGTDLETVYAKDTNATVTLYAQWEAVSYTVKLYRNDGSGEPAQTIAMDIGKTLSSKSEANLTRNGYNLVSWNTRADGRGKKYSLAAKNLAKPGETIELYAQWSKPVSYKITYDLQGGKNPVWGTKNPTKYTVESTVEKRTLIAPTKKGYTFVKWVDASAQDPENAPAVTVIPVDACRNMRLRAVWKENSYRVIYHGANEQYTDVTDTVEKTYKYTELADAFTPAKAYTLKEGIADKVSISAWTTAPNGRGKSYAVSKGFSKLSADDYNDITGQGTIHLYAKWSTAVYKITYENCDAAEGVKNSNAASYTYHAAKTISVKQPSRAGYVFAGWTVPDGKDYFDRTKNCIKAGTAEDVVLTANWTPITYEVKLNLNTKDTGISFKTGAVTVYGSRDGNGIAYNIESSSFDTQNIVNIPAYYELAGWNTKANGKGIAAKCAKDENGKVTSVNLSALCKKNTGTVTLYAIWKPKTYSVTYRNVDPDSTGAEITELTGVKMSNPATYTYNASKTIKLKNPSKYGFVFEGWYTDYDAATGVYTGKVTSIPKGSYGDITLYGKWRVK